MARDPEYISLINSRRWQSLRRRVLTDEPLCRRCQREGRLTSATEVHHARPVQSGIDKEERARLAYDRANLVPLCSECHQRTHIEMKSKGSRKERERRRKEEREDFCRRFYGDDEAEDPGGVFLKGGRVL